MYVRLPPTPHSDCSTRKAAFGLKRQIANPTFNANFDQAAGYRCIADHRGERVQRQQMPSWRRRDNFRKRQQQCVKPTLASTTFKLTGRSGSHGIGSAGRHSAGIGGCFHRNTQSFEGYGGALNHLPC
jgi:hypothetical protein